MVVLIARLREAEKEIVELQRRSKETENRNETLRKGMAELRAEVTDAQWGEWYTTELVRKHE